MSQNPRSAAMSASSSHDLTDKKDENENNTQRVGLLKLSNNLLSGKCCKQADNSNKPGPSTSTSPGSATTSSTASQTTTTAASVVTKTKPVSVSATPATATAASSKATSTAKPQEKKKMEPETVTELKVTLESDKLREEFRTFLRTKLDNNKSDNKDHKKMFEQWLDYVMLCDKIFELPETEIETRTQLMSEVGTKYLAKPPDGYNMALKSQLNRKELVTHCTSLADRTPDLAPNTELLKDGYEFIFGKLDQKHDIFRKTYTPTTTLAALLCSVL